MTSRVKSSLAAFALACLAIGAGLSGAQPSTGADPKASRFDHEKHKKDVDKLKKKLDCEDCHGLDKSGKIAQPGAQGHHPCMQSGCHSDLFLASGKSGAGKPEDFKRRQTAVCTVCHNNVPAPWQKAPTKVLKVFESQVAHHVEMDHFTHATKTKLPKRLGGGQVDCRTCHVVNTKGADPRLGIEFGLAYNAPGHAECVICHNPQDEKELSIPHTMGTCSGCHKDGSRASYYGGARPDNKVRACDSEGLELLKKAIEVGDVKLKKPGGDMKAKCFKHETKAHRFKDHKSASPTQPVQCNACHHIVTEMNPKKPAEPRFKDLKDLKSASIIDSDEQKQHDKCGASGCHAPLNECGFCHADVSGF
jgi:hypothetical protein